jgi:dihydrofolate synthase/folylpolyglutamate synthase
VTARERLFALEQFGIKLGLDNITRLVDALGHPERAWKSVHVAGTNGKGSVTAMVERGLRAAGYRTGRYTSPHLSHVEERIAIDGVPVTPDAFDRMADALMAVVDRLTQTHALDAPPTFFEVTTAMAFEMFRRADVEVAVVEVGLGGRFDSTNVITPEVSVITSIAFDHERHLGSSLEQIAFEKAGIIKPGVPVVVGELPDEAMSVVRHVAAERHAPVVDAGLRHIETLDRADGRPVVAIRTPRATYGLRQLSLAGAHQARNAVVAVRTLESCAARGLAVDTAHVVKALTDVQWPARLEWLPLGGDRAVLLDAAHNPEGAAAFADYARDAGIAPLPLVIAILRDKNVAAMLDPLLTVASRIVATRADSPRSHSAGELAALVARQRPGFPIEACDDPVLAVGRALAHAPRIAVAGSIFLVGPLRELLLSRATPVTDGL